MKKILFLDSVHPILEERLTKTNTFNCLDASSWLEEKISQEIKDAFGLVIRSRFPMNESFLKNASELKFIARSGAGMENIDEFYCSKKGIQLFNSPEGNRNAVAEHALGMLLAMMNKIPTANRDIKSFGKWERDVNRGEELDGKTIGIIGYGNNGSAFAKKLKGFDVKVLAYDKYKSGFGDAFVHESTLKALVEQADVISFHIPQNTETIYYANEEFFDSLAKPFYLLNLSRGKIVETKYLVLSIDSGKCKGAALDVNEFEKTSFEEFFKSEKLPDGLNYLLASDKVILTPHIGGWTNESYFKLSNILADKILSAFEL